MEGINSKWFDIQNILYNDMWDDDKFWLLLLLENKKTKCKFFFDYNPIKSSKYVLNWEQK
jgi:hypothetical protein